MVFYKSQWDQIDWWFCSGLQSPFILIACLNYQITIEGCEVSNYNRFVYFSFQLLPHVLWCIHISDYYSWKINSFFFVWCLPYFFAFKWVVCRQYTFVFVSLFTLVMSIFNLCVWTIYIWNDYSYSQLNFYIVTVIFIVFVPCFLISLHFCLP